jgi:hypothetical protein
MRWAALALVVLGGCSMVHRYRMPDGRPEALVSFVAYDDDAGWSAALYWVDRTAPCAAAPSIATIRGDSRLMLSSPTVWNLPIEAKDPVRLRAELHANSGLKLTCSRDIEFNAQIDRRYKVSIEGRNNACRVAVTESGQPVDIRASASSCETSGS